jgi:hypothetical protein
VAIPSKTGMVATSVAGLAAAAISSGLIGGSFAPLGSVLGVAAAVLAAVGLLGPASVTRTGITTLVFSGLAFAGSALGFLALRFGGGTFAGLPWWGWAIIAFVLYLGGATAYGFAGQAQGVAVGARTALLVLLLLGVVPFANVPGLLGILITAIARKAQAPTSATPA